MASHSNGAPASKSNGSGLYCDRKPDFEWNKVAFKNGVTLSVYPDAVGDDLNGLQRFLENKDLSGALTGVHLLPVYESNADRGFAPKSYSDIDPKFGSWGNVDAIASSHDLTLEYMANHIGTLSPEYKDFVKKGSSSEWSDIFIMWNAIFKDKPAKKEELELIYTRKPAHPFQVVEHEDGTSSKIWNTFSENQIDIDTLGTEAGDKFLEKSFRALSRRNPKIIRLDAVGYLTKERGTSCFFEEPAIWNHLEQMQVAADKHGVALLAEVHEHYKLRTKLAEHGYWVYDFCLPMLVLHALHKSTAEPLKRWLKICPFNQVTCLDTHDGVGVPDVEDILTIDQIIETEASMCGCKELTQWTYVAEDDSFQEKNMTHQLNCTFFSSIQGRDNWYILARAIQMFTPGAPMVYYIGLLAGTNDDELAMKMESDRYLNRHYFGQNEASQALQEPVVVSLIELLRFRNAHPAFNGGMQVAEEADDKLTIRWSNDDAWAELQADMTTKEWKITHSSIKGGQEETMAFDLDNDPQVCKKKRMEFKAKFKQDLQERYS